MSNPMTVEQLLTGLRKWKIPYVPYKAWTTHNRNHKGPWGPVHGFTIHHTGSDSTDQDALLYGGYADLPGPLCQWGLDQKGTVHLYGHGRANHAGLGDDDVLNAVINENYDRYPPVANETNTDGNRYMYGLEIWYSGSHDMTDEQYFTLLKMGAMVCDIHDWTEKSVIGHGEWQPGKWDPGISKGKMRDMHVVRSDIRKTIERGPIVSVPPKSAGYKEIWDQDVAKPPKGHETPENPRWMQSSIVRGTYEMAEQALKNTEEILKLLKEGS